MSRSYCYWSRSARCCFTSEPVVVDADRLQLALHRRHDHHHLLDHRGGFLRGRRCSWPIASSASVTRREGRQPTSPKTRSSNGGSPSGPRSASQPCWRRAWSSGTSSSRFPPTPPRSKSWASNGSWSFRLPGKDGRLGTSDARYVSPDNPLGLNPDDPHGQDDVVIESDDLHLPVGKPVKVLLRSIDVLHDFYVPEFRAKMDMVPGMVTYFWFTPTRTGTFEVLCAELCGAGARPDARQGYRRRRERLSGLAGEAEDLCAIVGAAPTSEGNAVRRQ